MEKPLRGTLHIPGAIVNGQNAQLLTSTGIHSVDSILGGGLPVGTVTIIEEDLSGSYAKVMIDYFLAEGVVNNHSTLVASLDINPYDIIKNLPAVINSDPEESGVENSRFSQDNKMKIAFRYQNLPKTDNESHSLIGHHFDLSKTMSLGDIENSDICYWNTKRIENGTSMFANPAYNELLKAVKEKIKEGKFFLKDNPPKRNIIRIGIHSLGSPMWLPPRDSFHLMNESRDLDIFIFCLRALVRSAFAVAVITIPTHLYHLNSLDRCIHSSDIAIGLHTFSGTELENNMTLSDYHGFFHLTKLAAINSFASKHPGSIEYVFKLKRKKFIVEKLHLPPDVQEVTDKNSTQSIGCRSSNRQLLDF